MSFLVVVNRFVNLSFLVPDDLVEFCCQLVTNLHKLDVVTEGKVMATKDYGTAAWKKRLEKKIIELMIKTAIRF